MINNCLAAFLKSSQLIKFDWTHNKKHISEIHVNFVNMNRISVMIYKTHLDYWSEERDFKDLVQEYYLNHLEKDYQYIQQIVRIMFVRDQHRASQYECHLTRR